MNASEVIQKIIEAEGINPNILASKMGIARTQPIYDIINGKVKKISENYANKILSAYPHYNMVWLLTGMGDMNTSSDTAEFTDNLKKSYDEYEFSGNIVAEGKVPYLASQSSQMVPHIVEECADCGQPNGFDVAILEDQCPKYSIPGLLDCDFTIPARGRSMINRNVPEKSIKDGDIIGCKKWVSRSHIRWGEVYVLSTTGGITVKQIQPSEQDGCIRCVPFNLDEGFQPFELPVDEIYDWAIVTGIASVSMWS